MQLECRKRSHQTVTYAELHRFLNNDRIFQLIAVHIAKQMLRTVVLYSITYAGIVLGTLITTICVLNARLLSLHLVSQSASHCNQTLTHLSNQPTLFESSTTDRTLKWDHFKYSLDSKIVITNHRSAFKRAEKTQQGLKEALQQSQHHHQQQQPRHNQFRQFVAQMLSNHNLTRELFQTPVIKTPMLFNLFDSRLELIWTVIRTFSIAFCCSLACLFTLPLSSLSQSSDHRLRDYFFNVQGLFSNSSSLLHLSNTTRLKHLHVAKLFLDLPSNWKCRVCFLSQIKNQSLKLS